MLTLFKISRTCRRPQGRLITSNVYPSGMLCYVVGRQAITTMKQYESVLFKRIYLYRLLLLPPKSQLIYYSSTIRQLLQVKRNSKKIKILRNSYVMDSTIKLYLWYSAALSIFMHFYQTFQYSFMQSVNSLFSEFLKNLLVQLS